MKQEKQEFFVCLRLSRDDFRAVGFNPDELTDSEIQDIADDIGESCTGESGTFWQVLEESCEAIDDSRYIVKD